MSATAAHTVEKDLLVNNKYRITRRIGGGSFGEIYEGVGPKNKKVNHMIFINSIVISIELYLYVQVAVKFERQGAKTPQLRHEYKVYKELLNSHGFCNVSCLLINVLKLE